MISGWTKAKRKMNVAERLEFYSIPEPNSGCLLWTCAGGLNAHGRIQLGKKHYAAHRIAWEQAKGPIPKGLCVCHKCDVPACINVDHLFLGTHQDNMDDMNRKGRNVLERGSRARAAKLTEEQVLAIRADPRPHTVVGIEYGTDESNISLIRKRKTWTHI